MADLNTVIERWNGSAWAVDGSYTQQVGQLLDITCTSASVAVGQTGNGGAPVDRLAQRWNGSSWDSQSVQVPPGAAGSSLNGVSCVAAGPCIAVGYYRIGSSVAALVVGSST